MPRQDTIVHVTAFVRIAGVDRCVCPKTDAGYEAVSGEYTGQLALRSRFAPPGR